MKGDPRRRAGYYWVRFEGAPTVAEYVRRKMWRVCIDGPHWHLTASSACFSNKEVCELLSGRLEAPRGAA